VKRAATNSEDASGQGAASLAEVGAAVEALDEPTLARLQAYARRRVYGCGPAVLKGREDKDLVREAIFRTLDGRRTWQKSIPLDTHLFGAMRSIASHWEEEALADPAVPASSLSYETDDGVPVEPYDQVPSSAPDPERQAAGREELALIIDHFKGDPVASLMITCRMEGTPLSELLALGVSENELEAARKKVRRHATRLLGRGGKS